MVERKRLQDCRRVKQKRNKLGLRNQRPYLWLHERTFLWKTSKLKKLEGLAGKRFHLEIDREPFFAL
jgi:hypothetical protein